jgi:hypothetical protein
LNTASQKASSIRLTETSSQSIEQEIGRIENAIKGLKSDLGALTASPEFEQAAATMQKANDAEKQEKQFHAQLADLFSHASRAFTKYSYGLPKETEALLQMMTDEPWKILYENDISPYSSLLIEMRKSINAGKIQLKDSDKILIYLDDILKSLPEFRNKVQALRAEADSIRENDSGLVPRVQELEGMVQQHEEELTKSRQNLEQQRRQLAEKNREVSALLEEACDILADLTGQRYSLQY